MEPVNHAAIVFGYYENANNNKVASVTPWFYQLVPSSVAQLESHWVGSIQPHTQATHTLPTSGHF